MEMLAAETQQLKTLLPSDTYFCCEACGTIFETLEDIHYHIQTEHSQALQDEVTSEAGPVGSSGGIPQQEVIHLELPGTTKEWIGGSDGHDSSPSPKKRLISAGTSVTIAEDSLPVIPSQMIEEVVSVPSTASGALSAGCLSSAQSHTYNNNNEPTSEETHTKQPSFDREAQLVVGNQLILNSSRLLTDGPKIKCTECSQRFKSVSEMKEHSEASHGIPYLICQLCGRCFSLFEQLASHVIEFHKKRKDKSWSKEEMISCGFVKETRMYPCNQCTKRCPSRSHLEQHLKWHAEKPNAMPKFMCHLCIPRVREFASKTHLNRHIEQMHPAEDRALQAANKRAQSRRNESSSSSGSFAQGFTVDDGLEVTLINSALRSEDRKGSKMNLPDVGDDGLTSDKHEESDERELASAVERDLIVSNLMVRTSATHMSCAVCLKKFQDQAILRKHITNKHLSGPNALPAVGSETPSASIVYLDNAQPTNTQVTSNTETPTTIIQTSTTGVNTSSSNTNLNQQLGEEFQIVYTNGGDSVVTLGGQQYVEVQQSEQPENAVQFQWDVVPTELGQEVFLDQDGSCQLVSVDVGVAGEEEVVLSSPVDMETSLKQGLPSQEDQSGLLYLSDQPVENIETAMGLQPTQKQKRYQCPYCDESFKKFVRLQSHIQIRHPGDCSQAFEETTCKILQQQQQTSRVDDEANQIFINAGEPAEVVIDENGVASGQFYQMEVITSGQVQTTMPGRNSTSRTSRGQRSTKLAPRTTTYTIKNSSSFSNANRKDVNNFAVSNERPFLCQECGKAYKLRSHLAQHIRYHTGEKPFKCDICGQGFHLSGDRNRHVIKMHSDYRPHQCPYCPKGFVDRYALNNHMKLHMSEHSFKCEYCDEKFPSKALMKQHRVSHFF